MSGDGYGRMAPVRYPGLLQDDPESVERRKWYSDMEKPIFDMIQARDEVYRKALGSDAVAPIASAPKKERKPSKYLYSLIETPSNKHSLVCFHGVGGSLAQFMPVKKLCQGLGDVNVHVVCLAGKMHRINDPLTKSFRTILFELMDEIINRDLSLPKPDASSNTAVSAPDANRIVFLGHDFGAILAYELCRLLSFQHRTISKLIVVAAPAPLRLFKSNCDVEREKLINGNDKTLLNWLFQIDAVPPVLVERRDMLRRFLPPIRNDLFLYEHYHVQQPYLAGQPLPVIDSKLEMQADFISKNDLEELLDLPPSLFKVSIPLVSMQAGEDSWIRPDEVEAWKLCSSVDHVHHVINKAKHFCLSNTSLLRVLERELRRELNIYVEDDTGGEQEEEVEQELVEHTTVPSSAQSTS